MAPTVSEPPTAAEWIDEIARLDTLMNSVAAQRSAAILAFGRAHVAAATATGVVEPEKLERDIAAQVGLAIKASPTVARAQVRIARDLHDGHDRVRELYAAGLLSEYKVSVIVAATAALTRQQRAAVDQELADRRVESLGVGRIRDLARRLAAQTATDTFQDRARTARARRYAHVRPAVDGMAYLSAYLPMEQAVACYGALYRAATDVAVSPAPDDRTRAQVMADTLVERLTGQAAAPAVPTEVQVLVPVEALLDPAGPTPAEIPGYGPVPAARVLRADTALALRRLLTRDGIVIGGDTRRRTFTGALATFLRARDGGRCREPYCDAPIRHLDHIDRWADGGATTFDNGRGLCAFHNHVRETGKWRAEAVDATIVTTTPTGHTYTSDLASMAHRPRAPRRRRRHAA